MKKFLLLLLLLCTPVIAEQILLVTLKADGTSYKITDTQMSEGFAPLIHSGGQYSLTKNGQVVARGNFALPGEVVLERFNSDGTIDGEIQRQKGTFTVAIPATNLTFDEVSLADSSAKPIGTADVTFESEELDLEEIANEGDFFIRYEWLWLLVKWIVIIAVVIVVIRKLLKMRKKTP